MARKKTPDNPNYMLIKHNTWMVRCQIPKDVRWYFDGKREYKKSTHLKIQELEKAKGIRDTIVEDFKKQVAAARNQKDHSFKGYEPGAREFTKPALSSNKEELNNKSPLVTRSSGGKREDFRPTPDIAHTYYRALRKKMDWLRMPSKVSKAKRS